MSDSKSIGQVSPQQIEEVIANAHFELTGTTFEVPISKIDFRIEPEQFGRVGAPIELSAILGPKR